MDFRWSASFIKKYKACKFFAYCKLFKQPTGEVELSYGLAGNVVHKTLEYYYEHLSKIPREFALVEVKNYFNNLWEDFAILNPKIDKNLYWLSVINGINLNVEATNLEYEFLIKEPFSFIGYADIINTNAHWVGDWKTASYKKSKVDEYKEQLKYYAWAYHKIFGEVPYTWVYFNKSAKIFKFKHTLDQVKEIEREILTLDFDLKGRLKTLKFPRTPSRTNCYFCPYKQICSTDHLREEVSKKYPLTFHLKKNKLLVEASIPTVVHRQIEKITNYEVKNAHFRIAAMKARGINYDGIKRLYRRREYGGETFIGFIHQIRSIFRDYAHGQGMLLEITIKDYRDQDVMESKHNFPCPKLNIPFNFHSYQNLAVDFLIRYRWGIIEIGTGGGKTAIAAECIRRLQTPTLFVIDNKDLLLQTKTEYESMLGIKCGIVGLGYREWDYPIVLSTIQTLAKDLPKYAKYLQKINLVIYDEVHIIAAKSFEKLSKYLENTKYRFGFSATAKRDDGDDFIIYAHSGQVVYKKNAKDLIDEQVLVKPLAIFHKYESSETPAENYATAYRSNIVDNKERNQKIVDLVHKYISDGKQVMVLTKLIDHGNFLHSQIRNSRFVYGKTANDIRVSDLEDFKEGKFKVLVGNIMIFNKGINIKNLDVVINATGNAGDVLTIQTIGRALRKFKGKKIAYYLDFLDPGEYFKNHSKSRIEALRSEGYEIIME